MLIRKKLLEKNANHSRYGVVNPNLCTKIKLRKRIFSFYSSE